MSKHIPKVSIGMPVFNGGQFIRDALDSLLAQTFTDFELIISDNGSTDGTEAICQEYARKDSRVLYVRQPENRGGLFNFRFVLEKAVGEYFMWAAHDDIWSKGWVEAMVCAIGDTTDVCAFGRVMHVDEHGAAVSHIANDRPFAFYSSWALVRRLRFFLEPEALGKANAVYGLFPRKAILAYLPVFLRDFGYGDCVMLWCMLSQYRLASVDNAFLYKRLHEGAASGGKPSTVSKRGWREKIKGLYFMVGTNLSFRGNSDYLRADPGLAALFCLFLAPVKMLLAIFKVRTAARHMSTVKTANG